MTQSDLDAIREHVAAIVADALNAAPDDVHPYSSLMDDLGAESIDFIDIVFRLESTFNTVISSEELWAGSQKMDANDPASIARGIEHLRATMPEFAWDKFPKTAAKRDLPRLITVNSIAEYVHKHLVTEAASKR
ncbi:MAG TPA: acyl carrier protein [Thermoanaerobaculia bacterium]|jgi:acyl carrier protein